ncbi:MAG: hypothetical protein RJA44_2180 [Pseudomonadota bacterium]
MPARPSPPPLDDADATPGAAPQRVQMADLARMAGVSITTVSRALSGSSEISAKTRERINALARSLNYTVHQSAKNLRLKHNSTIAVVIPYASDSQQHISDPFFLTMLGSLADELTGRGYDMLLSRVDAARLDSAGQLYQSGAAAGILLIGQWHQHGQLNELADRQIPLVVWGAELPEQRYCSVGGDNYAGGLTAARHLLQRGCRRLLFIGDPDLPEVAERLRGHLAGLAEAGLSPDPALLLGVPFEVQQMRAGLSALLQQGVVFDAVQACSDVLAIAAMQLLRQHGRQVPNDVAVVGYDDIEWASHADPPLSTVLQPIRPAGAEMVDALLALMAGRRVRSRTLPVELVARQSSQR